MLDSIQVSPLSGKVIYIDITAPLEGGYIQQLPKIKIRTSDSDGILPASAS
jgi:hypothetical protein